VADGAAVCTQCGAAVDAQAAVSEAPPAVPSPEQEMKESIAPLEAAPLEAPRPAAESGAAFEPMPMFTIGNDLAGIGGWLILVAIGLGVAPFFRVHGIVVDSRFLFSSRLQARISARPGLEAILCYELLTNSFFFVFLLLLNFLFYTRRRSFPSLMIASLVLNVVTQLIDHLWASHFGPATHWEYVLQAFGAAAIWIPYMINSIRVEQTFVN
jgi:hypothetical protein